MRQPAVAINGQVLVSATELLAAGREVIEKHVRLWGVTKEAYNFLRSSDGLLHR